MTRKTRKISNSEARLQVSMNTARDMPLPKEERGPIDPKFKAMTETEIVEVVLKNCNFGLRAMLSVSYMKGQFGQHDPVKAYAWNLAAWNCGYRSYDEAFEHAQTQQYFEFLLSDEQQSAAIAYLMQILPIDESTKYVQGKPFNGNWWGWEDDPIPARPGEHTFKAEFISWVRAAGYSDDEVNGILNRCPPSDGPTGSERMQIEVQNWLQRNRPDKA